MSLWDSFTFRTLAKAYCLECDNPQLAVDAAEAVFKGRAATFEEYAIKIAGNDPRLPAFLWNSKPGGALVPYNSAVSDAATLWQQYATAGEKISTITSGAQSQPLVYETTGPTSFVKTTTNKYKAASLLSLELPTACAALAPVLGVKVGYNLYKENPTAWETISRRLLPFCYEDSTAIPSWVEATEAAGEIILNALVPASIIAALKGALTEAGILNDDGQIIEQEYYEKDGEIYQGSSSGRVPVEAPSITPQPTTAVFPDGIIASGSGSDVQFWNTTDTPKNIILQRGDGTGWGQISVTSGGMSRYWYDSRGSHIENYDPSDLSPEQQKQIDAYKNGEQTYVLPKGVNPWGETIYYPQPGPLPQVSTGTDSTTGDPTFEDAYPIPLPNPLSPEQSLTDPFPYPSESIDPIPWPQPQPDETIEPYRLPDPVIDQLPWPDTETDPWPKPEPDPYPKPRPDPEPENPTQPQPTGPDIGPTDPPPPSDGDTGPTPLGPDIMPPWGAGTDPDGLIAVYNPPVSTLRDFAKWLWVTWPQAGLDKIWNNPFDGVISLFELYCTPPVNGSRNIRSGFLDSGINSPTIDRYTTINCGSLIVPEYWNNYLDYAPYTQVSIYLPFIGIVNVDANDIVGHSVNITYNIDCYNGSCIAMITVAKAGPDGSVYNCLAYQFSGNCAVDVPLSGGSQAAIKGAIINASAVGIGGLIMGAAQMNAGKMLSGAGDMIVAAEHALSSVMSARSSVQKSGSFGASFGAMGAKRPYIMVKRPVQVVVRNYNELYGYQAHKAVTIGQCRGYIRCREVHVESPTASDAEKNKIAQMLKDGVWI